jgi:hypothetical protein
MSITIPPFGSVTIKVKFKPTVVGPQETNLRFSTNTTPADVVIPIHGVAVETPVDPGDNPNALRDTGNNPLLDTVNLELES